MNVLRIYNYEIMNFESDPLVFSSAGFTKITEPGIVSALMKIEQTQSKYIKRQDLERILKAENLDPLSAVDFLKSLLILEEGVKQPYFEHVIIYHDMEVPSPLIDFYAQKNISTVRVREIGHFELPDIHTPTLFVFACLKIQPDAIRRAYKSVAKNNPGHGVTLGFIINRHFHLTEIHVPVLGNPCAFCTLDRIAYYESKRLSQHAWSKAWAFCSKNRIDLPKATIDDFQLALILGGIDSFTSKLTKAPRFKHTQDQTLLSRTIDLETGAMMEDTSIHWPFCECLRK